MRKFIFTKEDSWLKKWDAFVFENSKGSHLLYSDWLTSYTSYGFDFELGLVLDGDTIIAGCGVVIPKFLFFKFYIIPHGPVFENAHISCFNDFLIKIKERAQLLKCCYVQFSLPLSDNDVISKQSYLPVQFNLNDTNFKSGKLFNYVYCSYGLNWLSMSKMEDDEELLKSLKNHARRNIKASYNNNLLLSQATDKEAIKAAYEVVEINAQNAGYKVRKYEHIKQAIITLINNGTGLFLVAHKNNRVLGSAFFIRTKYSLTYIFGGTLKDMPSLRVGYFLHWEAIKLANNYNLGYNISMGGSKGVLRFKSQFNTKQIFYQSPHHYMILNKSVFNTFIIIEKHLKHHKGNLANILSKFKIYFSKFK
ncbi:aminoacyltransferase [Gelidibacter sp. F2691]|nr:aminoacyltransferase [Gelidibacter sp. F2691]